MVFDVLYIVDSDLVSLSDAVDVEVKTLELGEALLTKETTGLDLHLADILGWQAVTFDNLTPAPNAMAHQRHFEYLNLLSVPPRCNGNIPECPGRGHFILCRFFLCVFHCDHSILMI